MQLKMNRIEAGAIFTALLVLREMLDRGGEAAWAEARRTLDESLIAHGHAPEDVLAGLGISRVLPVVEKCTARVGFRLLEHEKLKLATERANVERAREAERKGRVEQSEREEQASPARKVTVVVKTKRPGPAPKTDGDGQHEKS